MISESKQPLDTPNTWEIVRLGDIATSAKGKKPVNLSQQQTKEYDIPYIDIRTFELGIISKWTDGEGCVFCDKDDVLIVWDGSRSGLIGKAIPGAIGSTLARIHIPLISKTYLYYFLSSKYVEINAQVKGSGTPHVNPYLLWNYLFPLPPLPEQRRIVAKIERLFSELDKGVAELKKAKEKLELYRQSLLKAAFEGRLTEQWRKEHAGELESADELLARIKAEREKRYQQQLEEWKQAVKEWEAQGKPGKKPVKPKKPKELPPLTEEELAELPELPQGWMWVKIDTLAAYDQYAIKAGPFGSALKKQFYVPSGYKIYGQEQVISGDWKLGDYYIDWNKYKELENCKVKPFDVLISLVGTVGKVLVLPENIEEGIINPRLIKISFNKWYMPFFFKYFFESDFLKSLYKLKTHGATMDVLNLSIIKELPFPLCALEEQGKLIEIIKNTFSSIDHLTQTIDAALTHAEFLRQSILKKAFSGKLVPQDPNDEPASELLKRIKAEREKVAKEKKPTRKTHKKKGVQT